MNGKYTHMTSRRGPRPVQNRTIFNGLNISSTNDSSGHVVLTIGPLDGPFETVYLDHAQALTVAADIVEFAQDLN